MGDILQFPIKFRPRLVRDGCTPADDLAYALGRALAQKCHRPYETEFRERLGLCERPCDSGDGDGAA